MQTVRLNRYDLINAELPYGSFADSRYEELQGTIKTDKDGIKYLEIGKGKDRVLKFCWGVKFHGNRSLKKVDFDLENAMAEAKYIMRYKARR